LLQLTGNKVGVCGEVADSKAPNFPFIETVGGVKRATIGPLTNGIDKIVFGWDSYRNIVINPYRTFELNSYCQVTRWISSHTYSLIRTYIQSTFGRRKLRTSRKLQTSYTVIRALINTNNMTTMFLPAFKVGLSTSPPPSNSTEYQVVGKIGSGGVAFRVAFDPIVFNQDLASPNDSPVQFNSMYVQAFVRPPATGIASIQVEQGGSVIGNSHAISVNSPVVTVIFPNGGESLSGATTTISWRSSDSDGDTLTYFVLFSPDNGATWITLATDHLTTSLEVPLDALGKTNVGLIRVQASDGFNTGEDVSDATFITPNIPPEVQILSPSNGNYFVGSQLVVFQAASSDTEDGQLTDSNLLWKSDIDGNLGTGRTFEILASGLTENNHIITLTGYDSNRATAVANVNITIYRIAPNLPAPTISPTQAPAKIPTMIPTKRPAIPDVTPPTPLPTKSPTKRPLVSPTTIPTKRPTAKCKFGFFNFFCFISSFFRWLINIFKK
jgi:hypothetical protein